MMTMKVTVPYVCASSDDLDLASRIGFDLSFLESKINTEMNFRMTLPSYPQIS